MPPNSLDLVLRAHPTQGQVETLQNDNRALLEVLVQRGSFFEIPRLLLRRQIVDYASRTVALRAIACKIMHCSIPSGVPSLIKDLKWLRSVPVIGEEAMVHVVDLGITTFHSVHYPTYRLLSQPSSPNSELLENLDDALLEMVCKHYYANSVYPNQWCTDRLYSYVNKIVGLYLDPDWLLPASSRHPRQGEFMARARRHLRKCHTHRLASLLANRICGKVFPEELVEQVRLYLYDDEHISSCVLQDGTLVSGATIIEDLDK